MGLFSYTFICKWTKEIGAIHGKSQTTGKQQQKAKMPAAGATQALRLWADPLCIYFYLYYAATIMYYADCLVKVLR
jgi:hypothetical protein